VPTIPVVGITPELLARAQYGARNAVKPKGPSSVQKAAATRVRDLYKNNIGDPRYRENMLGPKKSGGEITWETQQLHDALALASLVDSANGRPHDEATTAKHEAWKKALK